MMEFQTLQYMGMSVLCGAGYELGKKIKMISF